MYGLNVQIAKSLKYGGLKVAVAEAYYQNYVDLGLVCRCCHQLVHLIFTNVNKF
ncbi:hypothetical protein [Myxosarcina sp. GI1]|uniref:hypothetical protein n=1 Tax=Myxosarcina sp. GI1 TaxID=1541065 RepID=UPI0012E0A25B|nr:hypothetical protein [Myxosarcina sp. GI1]